MLAEMKPQSVVIDMSIDQGGCLETSRPTTHSSPTYVEEGVIHYCVPNMSGVLGRTATYALYIGAHRYLKTISELGIENAIQSHPALERSLNTHAGKIIHMKRAFSPPGGDP
jgi:alanine dehydrogenase